MEWKIVRQDEHSAFIVDENDIAIFTMTVEIDLDDDKYTGFEIDPELATQIVQEHNSHDALLAACKLAMDFITNEKHIPMRGVDVISLENQLQSAIEQAGEGV